MVVVVVVVVVAVFVVFVVVVVLFLLFLLFLLLLQVKAVEEIRNIVKGSSAKDGHNELELAVSAEFRQWLKTSGNLRQVSDLMALSAVSPNK